MFAQKFYLQRQFSPDDIDWSLFEEGKLSEDDQRILRTTAGAEAGSLSAEMFILKLIPDTMPDLRACTMKWAADEMKHSFIMNEYCDRFVPEGGMGDEYYDAICEDFNTPPSSIPLALTTAMCTEFTVLHWYLGMSERFQEPLAKKLFKQIATDESRHGAMFMHFIKELTDESTMKDVLGMIYMFITKKDMYSGKLTSFEGSDKPTIYERLPHPETYDDFFDSVYDKNKLISKLLRLASDISGQKLETKNDLKRYFIRL